MRTRPRLWHAACLLFREEWSERLDVAGATPSTRRLIDFVLEHVAVTPRVVHRGLGVARQTAYTAVQALVEAGILEPVVRSRRGNVYVARELIELLAS